MFAVQLRNGLKTISSNVVNNCGIATSSKASSLFSITNSGTTNDRSLLRKSPKRHRSTRPEPKTDEIIIKSAFGSVDIPNVTLPDYIFRNSEQWADKPALTCAVSGRSYSYFLSTFLTERFAQALLTDCGLKPGDTIAMLLPNIPEFALCIYGALKAGLIVTFVNPLYTPDEIKRQFENANTKAIITIELLIDVAKQLGPMLPGYVGTINVGGQDDPKHKIRGLEGLMSKEYEGVELPSVNPHATAVLPYSSGTTGLPKGVQLSHRNLVSNLCQGLPEIILKHTPTTETKQDKALTVLPFFHIYGFNGILNLSLRNGMHVVTIPKFTPEDYLKALMEYKPEHLFVVPSLLLFLATHPGVNKDHMKSVTSIVSGAAPASPGLVERFRQKFGHNIDIRQGYGMTEASPVILMTPTMVPKSKIGTTGQLYPSTEAKVIEAETGKSLGPHQQGELLCRGPQVMMGYWNNEKATQETIDNDGWLHTGDVVYYDDDEYFFIVDRTKELIKVKGNQVSPTELESIILELPGVADVAVVGVPDELADEVPRAYIVLRPGVNPPVDEKAVCDYLHARVIHYKRLKGGVRIIEQIPRNPSGKVLRQQLKVLA